MCTCMLSASIRYKIDLNPSNNFKTLMVAFLLNVNAVASHNCKLRTKPFWRLSDRLFGHGPGQWVAKSHPKSQLWNNVGR